MFVACSQMSPAGGLKPEVRVHQSEQRVEVVMRDLCSKNAPIWGLQVQVCSPQTLNRIHLPVEFDVLLVIYNFQDNMLGIHTQGRPQKVS